MVWTVVEILNYWNAVGVFSYVLPFLLVFAVVFAILDKANILNGNKSINTIVAASIGLLSLQFDMVPMFFANIFPKMGVYLAVVLVILIFLGFTGNSGNNNLIKGIGIIAAIIVVLWAMSDFWWFGGYGGDFYWWFEEYLWSIIVLAAVAGAVIWVGRSGSGGSKS